jgi:hypothetical protein
VSARAVLVCALLGVLLAGSARGATSDATFVSRTSTGGSTVTADRPTNYLHAWTQGSDPTGLTAYATQAGTTPATPAATGSDATTVVDLGRYKNALATVITTVLVVAVPATLPTGVTSVTVRVALAADVATGLQPITATTFAAANGTGTCTGSTVTLTAGQRCQLNLTVLTRVSSGFSNNSVYVPAVYLIANIPGYTGSGFLDYAVPVTISTS